YPGTSREVVWFHQPCSSFQCGTSGGGGVSRFLPQLGYAVNAPGVIEPGFSKTGVYCGQQPGVLCREVPDVSLNSDKNTSYSIYCSDPGDKSCLGIGWLREGGTSAAAPLWAGITALADSCHVRGVNAVNDMHHRARLGLLNPTLYSLDSSAGFADQLHDITI